jgi:hypothetical protein
MIYRLAADFIVFIHIVFVLFVLLGGLLVLRWKWIALFHLPAAAWAAAMECSGWICPLTPLENALRAAGGAEGYSTGFIEHYLVPLLYPPGLTPGVQDFLGYAVVTITVVVYTAVVMRAKRFQRRRSLS